jgi:hypothetical protein
MLQAEEDLDMKAEVMRIIATDQFLWVNFIIAFYFIFLIVGCTGVHRSIYKGSYNVSNISHLNSPLHRVGVLYTWAAIQMHIHSYYIFWIWLGHSLKSYFTKVYIVKNSDWSSQIYRHPSVINIFIQPQKNAFI